jgi:hypothetical protein
MAAEISPQKLVPFRWPTGWTDAGLVKLLEGGPINCLLPEGSAPLSAAVAETARKAGLVVREASSLTVAPLSQVDWRSPAPVVAISGLVWPSIKLSSSGRSNQADAGPTGAPWIDSNCWVTRLARVRAPGKTIWLDFTPPKDQVAPGEAASRVAIADSAAAGARWIVNLHDGIGKGLPAGNADAVKTWRGMLATLAFFERHREWASYEPWGSLGVLSTFSGGNEFMGQELLNLAARRNLHYRVLDRSLAAQNLQDLRAVLYVDSDAPSAELKARLAAFARNGGLLIVPHALASQFPAERPRPCPVIGYELRSLGKGSLAAAARDWDDPYFLAADVHSLVSRRNDPVVLFNSRSLWEHYSVAPAGPSELLQLVGFTGRNNESVSIATARPSRSAALYVPDSDAPTILQPLQVEGRLEYHLPPFSVYAALEFHS